MCLAELLKLFQKKSVTPGPVPPIPPEPPDPPAPALTIPYPEEPPDPARTMDNTDPHLAETLWRTERKVPASFTTYPIIMTDTYAPYGLVGWDSAPALTWNNKILYRPPFSNGGVPSHEVCHPVWAILTPQQQVDFETTYDSLINTDPLMILLYNYKIKNADPNWIGNPWEKHAEIYRYLGDKMPSGLKVFYPGLF
jgi:hypothetical protein